MPDYPPRMPHPSNPAPLFVAALTLAICLVIVLASLLARVS
jgi:hypothetical protein